MAYTKQQRQANEAEREAKLKAEMEARIKAELEAKLQIELEERLRAEYEEKLKEAETTMKEKAKTIQSSAKIPLDTVVPVICNVVGGAIYESQKIKGYVVQWDDYGSVEYMELSELVSMRNTARRFFEDNWIVLEDTEDFTAVQLYDFLKVTKLYENIFTPETIDSVFELSPKDIIKIVSTLSNGMKSTIATRAKNKIDAKELDSNNKIEALEEALNVKFSI